MTSLRRELTTFEMDPDEFAGRVGRAMTQLYGKIVQDGSEASIDEVTKSLGVLFAQVTEAIDIAEQAADSARAVRVAVMRSMLAIGMTMEDIGAVLGISRQRVGQLLKQIPGELPVEGRVRVTREAASENGSG